VNTSLNVGSPIVQTPIQALDALKRAKALSGLVMIAEDGQTWFVRHMAVSGRADIREAAFEFAPANTTCTAPAVP
jgi:hypothetical protein